MILELIIKIFILNYDGSIECYNTTILDGQVFKETRKKTAM